MRFGNFHAMNLLWLFAALLLFYIWSRRRRRRDMEKFAERELLSELTPSLDIRMQTVKAVLLALSILMAIVALMRPQWGSEWKEIKRSGLDILIALDTSKSMLAEDVRPNRLERSKLAIKDLLSRLHGDRVGLIAFSGSAFLQCPLTSDYSGFMITLDDTGVTSIPKGGTSISDAIRVALDSYEGGMKKYKILVIMTDGEDHEGSAVEWAEKAKEQGIRIYTVGIGTGEGDLIPVTDETGHRMFLKDTSGNVVKTRLDEGTLQKIALTTGGSYVRAAGVELGLGLLYDEKLAGMEKSDMEEKMVKRFNEKFQIPLAVALVLLCAELFIRERRKL